MTESDFESICGVDEPTVDMLIVTDLHLRATGEQYPVADLPVEKHDLVISLGDIIDENRDHAKSDSAGKAYENRGREFFENLDHQDIPVFAVPGNHDPVDCTQRLSKDLSNVHLLHRKIKNVVVEDDWSLTIAGWGYEQFDFKPALLSSDYPDIPVESGAKTPDVVASALLRAAGTYIAGDVDKENLAKEIGTEPTNYAFENSLTQLESRFNTLVELVEDTYSPTIVTSHVSPFNVPFDIREQHSHEGDYHFGSVALRLALAAAGVDGCFSGHTHQRGLTAVPTTSGHAYVHNPGNAGVSSVSVKVGDCQVKEIII